ncbi:MAG: hypothetical protein WBD28_05575 [Candidatus Zixiibacteriota bacterium]
MKKILFFVIVLAVLNSICSNNSYGDTTSTDLKVTEQDSSDIFAELLSSRIKISGEGYFQAIQPGKNVNPKNKSYFRNGKIAQPIEYGIPFHGAYLLHLRNIIKVTDHFQLLVRLIFEGRSFCNDYLDFNYNSVFWSKISGTYRLDFSGLSENDTLLLRMGDLERCRCGEGIALDEFEGEGYSLTYSSGNFRLENTHIGRGLNVEDDIIYTSFSYKDRLSLNLFANYNRSNSTFLDSPIIYKKKSKEYYQVISSISFNLPVYTFSSSSLFSQINFFGEGALSDDHRSKFEVDPDYSAFLIGMRNESRIKKNVYQLEFQYRYYAREFNYVNLNRVTNHPYTQLSLDKRFNNWINYLRVSGDISGINIWSSFKQFIRGLWFLEGTTEFLKTSGSIDEIFTFYDLGIGVEFDRKVQGIFFFTNKIFNGYLHRRGWYLDKEQNRRIYMNIQDPTFVQTKETLWGVRMKFQF